MALFYQPEISSGILAPEESRHAIKVLRLESGAVIELTDGKGNLYQARLTEHDPRHCAFKITKTISIPKRNFSIHIGIAPAKNADRMEWMVEKCVEIGIEKISFLLCKTSERKTISMERLNKIIISAIKQSRQAWLPALYGMMPFGKFIETCDASQKFISSVDENNPNHLAQMVSPRMDYAVLIGPEGDFTKGEIEQAISHGFRMATLGPNRLRTETAGLTACCILNLVNA